MRLGIFFFAALALTPVIDVFAQTIQLPSFTSFSVDTTVLVPDSGRAATARSKRAGSGSSNFGGFPKQRARGDHRQAAGMHVLAKIHDPFEADQAPLQQAAARGATAVDDATAANGNLARAAVGASRSGEPGLKSLLEIERQRANQSADQQREAFALYEKGRQAQAAGKTGAAAVFFRSASNRATGTLKQEIDADLKALKASATLGKSLKTAHEVR
jgi:hypothetical protein